MRVFLAVLKDLLDFVVGQRKEVSAPAIMILPAADKIAEIELDINLEEPVTEKGFVSVGQIFEAKIDKPEVRPVIEVDDTGKAYISVTQANMMLRPVWAFDSVMTKVAYGEPVTVFDYSGRFARVKYRDQIGWILKDEIAVGRANVAPIFLPNKVYLANDPETKKLRASVEDEFFAADLYLPLQGVEYVYYELKSIGLSLDWPVDRPRLAGSWQKILRGKLGVHIGISPKTGSVLEYVNEDGEGKIGYVEAVHPDESIVLTSVGRLVEGQFLKEMVSKEEWQSWRPVWLQIQ